MALICKSCNNEIKTLKEYYTKGKCRICYNAYMRNYYNENFKSDAHEKRDSIKLKKYGTYGEQKIW
jgi:hypothetical protein